MKTTKAADKTGNKANASTTKDIAPTKVIKPQSGKVTAKDKLGNRTGSQGAKINAVLTTRPQSVDAIVNATSLGKVRVLNHLRWLDGKGLVVASAEGYSVK